MKFHNRLAGARQQLSVSGLGGYFALATVRTSVSGLELSFKSVSASTDERDGRLGWGSMAGRFVHCSSLFTGFGNGGRRSEFRVNIGQLASEGLKAKTLDLSASFG